MGFKKTLSDSERVRSGTYCTLHPPSRFLRVVALRSSTGGGSSALAFAFERPLPLPAALAYSATLLPAPNDENRRACGVVSATETRMLVRSPASVSVTDIPATLLRWSRLECECECCVFRGDGDFRNCEYRVMARWKLDALALPVGCLALRKCNSSLSGIRLGRQSLPATWVGVGLSEDTDADVVHHGGVW